MKLARAMKTVVLLILFLAAVGLCDVAWTDKRAADVVRKETKLDTQLQWGRSWNISASTSTALRNPSVHEKHGSTMVDVMAEDWRTIQAIDSIKRSGVVRSSVPGTYKMSYSQAMKMIDMDGGINLLLTDESARSVGLDPKYGGGDPSNYPTPEEAYASMKNIAERNPSFAQLHTLGKSADGIDMHAVCFYKGGDVQENAPVPTVVWMQQHGQELIAFKIAMLFAEAYAEAGAKGDDVVVGQMSVFRTCVLPTANPDGVKAFRREVVVPGGEFVDPNRNFPYTHGLKEAGRRAGLNEHNVNPPISHENVIVMAWLKRIHAHAVWALHGGATGVFSVPRDTSYVWTQHRPFHNAPMRSVDDEAVRSAAGVFSTFSYDFKHNRQFPGGVINGNEWYPAKGSLCDWAEEELGVTLCGYIELGPKVPTVDMIMAHYFRQNYHAMLKTGAMVMRSFRAKVLAEDTHEPLEATVGLVRYRSRRGSYVHDGASSLFEHDGSMNSKHAVAVRGNGATGFVLKALPHLQDGYKYHVYVTAQGKSAKVIDVDVYENGDSPIDEVVVYL